MFKGFSLIELLVVVAIISVLASIALPVYSAYTLKSKVASVVQVMSSLQEKVQNYYAINGTWPNSAALGIPSTVDAFNNPTSFSPYLAAGYIYDYWVATNCPPNGEVSAIVFFLSGAALGGNFHSNYAAPYNGNYLIIQSSAYLTSNGTVLRFATGGYEPGTGDLQYLPAGWQKDLTGTIQTCS